MIVVLHIFTFPSLSMDFYTFIGGVVKLFLLTPLNKGHVVKRLALVFRPCDPGSNLTTILSAGLHPDDLGLNCMPQVGSKPVSETETG